MDIQELASMWNEGESSDRNMVILNRKLLKSVTIHEVRSMLSELKWSWIIELVVNALFFPFLIQFIIGHFQVLEFLVPGLIVLVVNVAGLIFSLYKIKKYLRLSPLSPVLDNQRSLVRLKYMETMEVNSLFVVIPVFSAPILIVLAQGLFGFNLYSLGDWIMNYTLGSLVIGVIVVFVIKKFPSKKLEEAIALLKDVKEIEKGNS